jgi:hypothetical protein
MLAEQGKGVRHNGLRVHIHPSTVTLRLLHIGYFCHFAEFIQEKITFFKFSMNSYYIRLK